MPLNGMFGANFRSGGKHREQQHPLIKEIEELKRENARLKRGDFTPEEFQNLCHNFSETDKQCFFDGCADYQRKLFGVSDRDEQIFKMVCTRPLHHQEGPCNGLPRIDCPQLHPVDKTSSKS